MIQETPGAPFRGKSEKRSVCKFRDEVSQRATLFSFIIKPSPNQLCDKLSGDPGHTT